MNYTFRSTPEDLRETSAWPMPDLSSLDELELTRFERMYRGIKLGLQGGSETAGARSAGCARAVLTRQLNRCLALDAGGKLMGWFGLIDHLRISPYRRHQDVPKGAVDGKGLAGAFEDFLGKHPSVVKALDRAILAREPGKPPGTKRHSRQVFRAFLRACRVPDERLSDADYPLNTKSKGRRSVYRYIERYLQRNPTKIGPWYGEDAAKRVKLGSGRRSFVFASRPFDESCADAHRIDCIGTLEVNGPAGPQRVPVQRLWLYLYVDTVSRAILGYHVSTSSEPSAAGLEAAIALTAHPWAPKDLSVPDAKYVPGAGLPYGTVPGLGPCRPARLTLDNGAQHYASRILHGVKRQLGCVLEFGPVGAWWHNSIIERLFETLEGYGFHRLSSSMGTGPADPCRRDPVGRAVRDCISQDELIELADVIFANYNATSSRPLGNQSPLDVIAQHLSSRRSPWLPRPTPPISALVPKLGTQLRRPFVRGSLKQGRAPYVHIDNVDYTSPELSRRFDLVGQKIAVHVDEWDMRTALAFDFKGGSLGVLQASGAWGSTPHSRDIRRAICALRNAGELALDEQEDPVQAYMAFWTKKARVEATAQRKPKVSAAASTVARISEVSGLPVPPVSLEDAAVPSSDATVAPLPRTGPRPNWSTVRR